MIKEVDILLVEDSEIDAELTIWSLNKINLGNKLFHVRDGSEALDFIFKRGIYEDMNSANPKVILLDIKMPKVDGLEVLRQLKENEQTRSIPVVIMTSSREEQDIIKSYKYGVNSYVVKPVEFGNFAKAVSDLGLYWLITNHVPGK
jgi:two-component system response regulator